MDQPLWRGYPGRSGRSRGRSAPRRARQAGYHRQGQRHGADLERHSAMGRRAQGGLALHRARKPVQNAFAEPFIGRLRDELLNETLFRSLPHARVALEAWRADYNTARPHSRLGWMSPIIYAAGRRSAALRSTDGSAQRTATTTAQEGISNGSTPVPLG